MALDSADPALLLRGALRAAPAFRKPERTLRNAILFPESFYLRKDFRITVKRRVGVNIENVKIIPESVLQHGVRIRRHGPRKPAECNRKRRVAGFESKIRGLHRGGIIPGAFRSETDVLFVPELPVRHFTFESDCERFAEFIDGAEIGGKFFIAAAVPDRRIVKHARNPDSAGGKQFGILHVASPGEFSPLALAIRPAQTVTDNRHAAAPRSFRNNPVCSFGMDYVAAVRFRKPALGTVHRIEHLRIVRAFRRIGNDSEGADVGEHRIGRRQFQFVISVRQRLQGKSSVRSERSPAQFDVLPVEQTPFHFTGIP